MTQRTVILLFLIALGYALKYIGVFGEEERRALGKVFTNITYPAVILSSYTNIDRDLSLLWFAPLGLMSGMYLLGTEPFFRLCCSVW